MEAKKAEIVPEAVEQFALARQQQQTEYDIQVATAKKYPRSITRFKERVLELATTDKETAEECWYSLPRGGKIIEGPGIRFAEIVAASYGNLQAGWRVIGQDATTVTCEGAAWDLETNVRFSIQVSRRIVDKYNKKFNNDMINMTKNACGVIALRNAIFKVVPKAIYSSTLREVQKIAMGGGRGITEIRDAIFVFFKGKGVSEEKVLALIGRKGKDDVTLEDATTLRGLATAIGEGTTTVKEAFSVERSAPAVATISRDAVSKGDASDHIGPGEATTKPEPKPKPRAKAPGKKIVPKDSVVDLIASIKTEINNILGLDAKEEWVTKALADADITVLDKCKDPNNLQDALTSLENLRADLELAAG